MIDHRQRFIHVHIHRCAGTAVERFFNAPYRYDHRGPGDYIKQYGKDTWDNYYKFAFIRNPWAKVVSHYFWRQQQAWWYAPGDELSFRDWVKKFDEIKEHLGDRNIPQAEWLSMDGGWAVDDIIQLSELNYGWPRVLDKLNIDYKPLPRVNTTLHGHYSEYYNNETREIVEEWYDKDIKAFGFTYNEG